MALAVLGVLLLRTFVLQGEWMQVGSLVISVLVDRHPADRSIRLSAPQQATPAKTGASMSYLKPFRRKLAVVTLLMACVFMAGWVRSISYSDDIEFWPSKRFFLQINSLESQFHMKCASEYPGVSASPTISMKWVFPSPRSKVIKWDATPAHRMQNNRDSVELYFREVGLKVAGGYQKGHVALITIPYWSIVLPLTLLSAWLLLSKPRVRTPAPSTSTGPAM